MHKHTRIYTPAPNTTNTIITPVLSENDYYYWGGVHAYDSDANEWFGEIGSAFYLLISLSVSGTLLLQYSIFTWKGKEFKWTWLIYILIGIPMIIFSILFWVEVGDLYEGTMVGFTSIGSFIAGILAIVSGVFEKMKTRA